MFDDLDTAEQKTEGEQKRSAEDDDKPILGLSRWSHVIAGLLFCVLYFPFKSHSWSLYVAIACAYSACAFAIALGLALENLDDIFGDPRIARYVATLLVPHVPLLGLIILCTYLWLYLNGVLPTWATLWGRRPSLWSVCGMIVFWFAGTREGIWMAGKIKRRLKETEDQAA
jgi:hypothetical protein